MYSAVIPLIPQIPPNPGSDNIYVETQCIASLPTAATTLPIETNLQELIENSGNGFIYEAVASFFLVFIIFASLNLGLTGTCNS
jgi:glycerol uptake facilitator-like aquaporin